MLPEPYRARLLPAAARRVSEGSARWRAGFPGRGRRCFALCDKPETAQRVADWLSKHYLQNQEELRPYLPAVDTARRTSSGIINETL